MSATIPEMMQAVLLEGDGGPLSLRQIPVPKPGAGEVLLRMAASPINPSDLAFVAGVSGYMRTLPAVPGNEGSGTVVASGSGLLARLLLGRRVACGRSSIRDGAWAEYMMTSASQCIPLQKNVSLEQGAMLIVNPMTAVIFLEIIRQGKHKAVVNTAAASQLGQMLLRLSLKYQFPLINIVRREDQVEPLRSMGARYVLVSSDPDFDQKLDSLTHALNATLILDAVGGELTQRLIDASPKGSLIMLYSNLSLEPVKISPNSLWRYDRRVEGFFLGTWAGKNSVLKMLSVALQAQRLLSTDLKPMIQRRVPLASAQEALEIYYKNMSAGKVLFVINP